MKQSPQVKIHISVGRQKLTLKSGRKTVATYPVSTSRFGLGTTDGSMKTPTGRFRIGEMIGHGMPLGTVFKSRRRAKVSKEQMNHADLVMTRILWLDGLDPENLNTRERFIYIHGTNHENSVGEPTSHGCVRMRPSDVVDLFERVAVGTPVAIKA